MANPAVVMELGIKSIDGSSPVRLAYRLAYVLLLSPSKYARTLIHADRDLCLASSEACLGLGLAGQLYLALHISGPPLCLSSPSVSPSPSVVLTMLRPAG